MNTDLATKKDLHDEIETAVGQISSAIGKVLEDMATKDDVKNIEVRLDKIEVRLNKIEDGMGELKTEVMYIKMDIRDLKNDTPSIVSLHSLEKRVAFLEKAVISS